MRHPLKSTLAIAAIVLAACGGGGGSDSVTPPPPPPPPPPEATGPYQATLIAGSAAAESYRYGQNPDPDVGCDDGAALDAKLNPRSDRGSAFARLPNGNLVLAEVGFCDYRFRIRAIDPAGNTLKTLAVAASRLSDDTTTPLTTFWTPTSLAVAPSGEIYIADSDLFTVDLVIRPRSAPGAGPGIWKLDAGGNVSLLAGVSLPEGRGVDGAGTAAGFTYIDKICHGSDGMLYVRDNSRIRTVSTQGAVTSLDNRLHMLACGVGGSVLALKPASYLAFSDNDDFYDPITQKPVGKVGDAVAAFRGDAISVAYEDRMLLYFGPERASVLIKRRGEEESDPLYYTELVMVNLADGSAELVARIGTQPNLTATPPTIAAPVAAVATGGTDFDILTGRGVIRFTRKP